MAKAKWECIKEAEFDGDIIITDPCYLKVVEDCEEWEPWIKKHGGLISRTFYGDWGCTVYNTKGSVGHIPSDAVEIGGFCADSGMVCVVGLDAVVKDNPKFMEWLKAHGWCGTIIRGFKGQVRFMTKTTMRTMKTRTEGTIHYKDVELHVRGDGTIGGEESAFESVQTSL